MNNNVELVNMIYQEMKNNIDIIKTWFELDNKQLDEAMLFKYTKIDFSPVVGNENDIYLFVNKMINNILYGKSFQLNELNYLESNFISLANIVVNEYKKSKSGGVR